MTSRRTTDLASAPACDARMRFYSEEKLSEHMSLTPEGYLAVVDVPLCRTGVLIYGPGETPVTTGSEGHVKIYRDPEEVFHPDHIASIVGKSVVNDHPPEDVTPDNFKKYHAGTILNPRRGDGAQSDLLLADILIMDPETIAAVQAGKREVSMGYDCDYEEIEPGIGKQHNIIANHVALVEAGRCGARCSIKDHKSTAGGNIMGIGKLLGKIIHRAKIGDRAVKDLEAELEKAKKEGADDESVKELENAIGEAKDAMAEGEPNGEHTHVHVHMPDDTRTQDDDVLAEHIAKNDAEHAEFRARLEALEAALTGGSGADAEEKPEKSLGDSEAEKAIEGELAEEAPPGTADQARKARDSAFLDDSYRDTVAGAEILAPGIRFPTFDKKAAAKDSLSTICNLRRNALDLAYVTPEGRGIIGDVLGGKSFDLPNMSCGDVRGLFRSAVAAKRASNNAAHKAKDRVLATETGIKSIGDYNKSLSEYWAKQNHSA